MAKHSHVVECLVSVRERTLLANSMVVTFCVDNTVPSLTSEASIVSINGHLVLGSLVVEESL